MLEYVHVRVVGWQTWTRVICAARFLSFLYLQSVPISTKDEDLQPLPLRRSSPVMKEAPENWSAKKKTTSQSLPIEEYHEEQPASTVVVDEVCLCFVV